MTQDPQAPGERASKAGGRALRRSVVLGITGALFYGGWALYVNLAHGLTPAIKAALTQAALSFSATFVMVLICERLFRAGRTPTQGFFLAAVGTSAFGVGVMATGHAISGTPRILATIAPSGAVSTAFFTIYAWGLRVAAVRARAGE